MPIYMAQEPSSLGGEKHQCNSVQDVMHTILNHNDGQYKIERDNYGTYILLIKENKTTDFNQDKRYRSYKNDIVSATREIASQFVENCVAGRTEWSVYLENSCSMH
jgi:hypothetical protein